MRIIWECLSAIVSATYKPTSPDKVPLTDTIDEFHYQVAEFENISIKTVLLINKKWSIHGSENGVEWSERT